jgi:hypothetical protein
MLLLYRFLWIASALGVAAVMIMLSDPRVERPVVSNEWMSVQQGRFSLQAPREFRAHRDALTQMGMNKPNSPVQLQDAVRIERGVRTGMKLALVTLRADLQVGSDDAPAAATPDQNAARLLQRIHTAQMESLREAYADLKETQTRPTRVQGAPALRTDFTFTLAHWVPLFNTPAQGYLITLPVSQTEALHIIAYCPPHRFNEYQALYERMVNTLKLNAGATTTASGGWE